LNWLPGCRRFGEHAKRVEQQRENRQGQNC